MRTIIFTALAAISLAANAAPAAAETKSVQVSYGDLDLTHPSGLAALNTRLQTAAKKVCGPVRMREVADGLDHKQCMQTVSSAAAIQVARALRGQSALALNSAGTPRR